jgi:hypothetical protein
MDHAILIKIKYLGATGARGARLKATCLGESVTIPYPHDADYYGKYELAAQAVLDKLNAHMPEGDAHLRIMPVRVLGQDEASHVMLAQKRSRRCN